MITQLVSTVMIFLTVYLLVKQCETRMVLIGSGIALCVIAGNPMSVFSEFSKYMVSSTLIMPICSSMGFAFVMKYTECDVHLVRVLSKVLSVLGFFLIPAAVLVTFMINIAIPSAAGCAAAVGATLIPLLIASRIHPAIAGAAVLSGTIGSLLSPGLSHNPFVADMSQMSVVELIARHSAITMSVGFIAAASLALVALARKEFNVEAQNTPECSSNCQGNLKTVNYLYATAPFVPLVLLIAANLHWFGDIKIDVPTAMLIGSIFAMLITFCNPGVATKAFFNGMGNAYGDILGIIIAAAVFSQGLKASGLVDTFIHFLIHSPEFARWGGTIGPFLMGIMTGSGDAAAYAFNNTVTPHAATLGYEIPDLGMASAISGALGRTMSPLAGAAIVCAGIAGVNPIELAKRTAPGMLIGVLFIALFML